MSSREDVFFFDGEKNLGVILVGFVIYELFFGTFHIKGKVFCGIADLSSTISCADITQMTWGIFLTYMIYWSLRILGTPKKYHQRRPITKWMSRLSVVQSVILVGNIVSMKHAVLLGVGYMLMYGSYRYARAFQNR